MPKKRIKISGVETIGHSKNRLEYLLHFLQNHPFAAGRVVFVDEGPADLMIRYHRICPPKETAFFIPAQGLFFNSQNTAPTELFANEYTHQDLKLYSVSPNKASTQALLEGKRFAFDLFETLFFHLSRYEEWNCPADGKNEWDLMRTEDQFLLRHQLQQNPVVDHLVYAFFQVLGLAPPRAATTYQLTHDIDEVQRFPNIWRVLRSSAGLWWRGNKWRSQQVLWQAYGASVQGKRRDPYDPFDWMLREGAEWKKTIYFLVGGSTRYDRPYDLTTKRMQRVLENCVEKGYEIGIHPSYATYQEEELFRKEKEQLAGLVGQEITHSRQHYLHFTWPTTPSIIAQQGISHDSSMGYNECLGFRCGTGFAYQLYDFSKERAFSFWEEPLVVMDSALFYEANFQAEKVEALLTAFLNKNKYLTQITFNFHNSRFFDAELQGIPLTQMYQKLFPQ